MNYISFLITTGYNYLKRISCSIFIHLVYPVIHNYVNLFYRIPKLKYPIVCFCYDIIDLLISLILFIFWKLISFYPISIVFTYILNELSACILVILYTGGSFRISVGRKH